MVYMGMTMRIMLHLQFFRIFAKRLGSTKLRSFAAFKAKKFYIGFRPVQKLKSYAR